MKKILIALILASLLTACDAEIEKLQQELAPKDNIESVVDSVTDEEEIQETIEEAEKSIENTEAIEVVTKPLSNETFAWGFRRMKNEVQPEFRASYVKPLNEYDGIYVGNKEDRVIYLTFDEGYENGYTDDILDTLKEKNVKAVFFVTMPYVKKNSELIQRMIDEGHIVGNQFTTMVMYHI